MYTPREAIDNINEILNSTVENDESLEYELTSYDYDWLKAAKSALEKQTSLKPRRKEYDFSDFTIACPKCGSAIINTFSSAKYNPNYCSYCGQALDWGDVK